MCETMCASPFHCLAFGTPAALPLHLISCAQMNYSQMTTFDIFDKRRAMFPRLLNLVYTLASAAGRIVLSRRIRQETPICQAAGVALGEQDPAR